MFNNISLHSCVSIAREKLHGAATRGAREDTRLCRWVLLKNSMTSALTRSTESPPRPITTKPDTLSQTLPTYLEKVKEEEEDAFLFPDGDVFAESFVIETPSPSSSDDELGSEAQWLDALLQSLGDDADVDDTLVTVVPVEDEEEYEDSDLASLLDLPSSDDVSLISTSSSSLPENIHLPPSPPLNPYASPPALYNAFPITYDSISDLHDNMDALALPDISLTEDSSSDTDSDSIVTPFTRSTSSLGGSRTQATAAQAPFVHIVGRDDVATEAATTGLSYTFDAYKTPIPFIPLEDDGQEC